MKQFAKRGLALVLAVVLILGLLSGLSFLVSAATVTVNYVYGSASGYSNVIANWGKRGVTATFLSQNAADFYLENDVTYDELAALDGSDVLSGVPSSELYAELQELMVSNHDEQTTYGETRDLYAYTDCQDSDTDTLTCFYSGTALGEWDSGATWNREHTWPKSKTEQGDCNNNTSGEVADIMMLRPVVKSLNGSRSNAAYGESDGYYDPNANSNYDVRGDVARIMLYVYVRWDNTEYMWGKNGVIESLDVLLKWMEEDPVDTWEMGRNDSVESITGVRNVFVDYPELAFLLFDEDIPAEMSTPSGEGYSVSCEITAVANGNGTVRVNGNTITAIADEGYEVSGYTVTEGTASVERSGDIFTVTAESDCTITISFAARAIYTARYVENGVMVGSEMAYSGDAVTLPNAATVVEGYTFIGWSAAPIADTETMPTVYKAGSKYVLTANTMLYAVYSFTAAGEGGVWTLVTDASVLNAGVQLVVTYNADRQVAGEYNSKNYLAAAEAQFSDDLTVINSLPDNATIFTLGGSEGAWTLSGADEKLLGTNGQRLYWGSGTTTWKISVSSDGKAEIVSTTSADDILQYNKTSPRFKTYKTASNQVDPELYYLNTASGSLHYTTGAAFNCDHTSTAAYEEVPATCCETGMKAHVVCTLCGMFFVDGNEVAESDLVINELNPENHSGGTYVVNIKTATCREPGYSGDEYCSGCDALLHQGEEVIDEENHQDIVVLDEKKVTCTEDGYTGDTYCRACDTLIQQGEVILSEGHQLTHVAAEEATCRTPGLKEHDHCSVCQKNFIDGEEVNENDVRVATLDHSYGDWEIITEATEETEGLKQHTCSECGYVEEEVIPMAEKPADGEDEKPEDEKPADDKNEDDKDDNSKDDEPETTEPTEKPIKPSDNVETGDSAPILLLIALLMLSACGIVVMHFVPSVRRKR